MAEPLTLINEKAQALISERAMLRQRWREIERELADCRAAARVFGASLETPEIDLSRSHTLRQIVLDQLKLAGSEGTTVKKIRPICGENFHPKSIGVALYRLKQAGACRSEGHTWIAN